MKTKKLSRESLRNVLTRSEMKRIMAGSGNCVGPGDSCGVGSGTCCPGLSCEGRPGYEFGQCVVCAPNC